MKSYRKEDCCEFECSLCHLPIYVPKDHTNQVDAYTRNVARGVFLMHAECGAKPWVIKPKQSFLDRREYGELTADVIE